MWGSPSAPPSLQRPASPPVLPASLCPLVYVRLRRVCSASFRAAIWVIYADVGALQEATQQEASPAGAAVFPAASAPGQGGGSAPARPLDGAQASKMRPVAAGRASGADPELLEALRHSPNPGGLTKPLGGCAEGAGRPRWVRRRWQGCSPGAGALPSNSQQFREPWTGEGARGRGACSEGPCAPPCRGHTHTGPTAGGRGVSLLDVEVRNGSGQRLTWDRGSRH